MRSSIDEVPMVVLRISCTGEARGPSECMLLNARDELGLPQRALLSVSRVTFSCINYLCMSLIYLVGRLQKTVPTVAIMHGCISFRNKLIHTTLKDSISALRPATTQNQFMSLMVVLRICRSRVDIINKLLYTQLLKSAYPH